MAEVRDSISEENSKTNMKEGNCGGGAYQVRTFNPHEWSLSRFWVGRPLGQGRFGRVYLAKEKSTNFVCVLKSMCKAFVDSPQKVQLIAREVEINSNLNHENVVKMYGYFADEKRFYIILEYANGGDLYSYMLSQHGRKFSESVASNFVRQLIKAVQYIHSKGVMHRDIKPENILLSDGMLKLSDFGWSVKHVDSKFRKTHCGTLDYTPPEMLHRALGHGQNKYTFAVDLWAIGVFAYEMNTGQAPFGNHPPKVTHQKISQVSFNFPQYFSHDLKDFLVKTLRKDPEHRMQINDMLNHPWIKKYETVPTQ